MDKKRKLEIPPCKQACTLPASAAVAHVLSDFVTASQAASQVGIPFIRDDDDCMYRGSRGSKRSSKQVLGTGARITH